MKVLLIFVMSNMCIYCVSYAKTTIPFVVKKHSHIKKLGVKEHEPETYAFSADEKIIDVPTEEIRQTLLSIKKDVCSVIESGEVKVWLQGSASGKLLGVGASSEAGIEVKMICAAKK